MEPFQPFPIFFFNKKRFQKNTIPKNFIKIKRERTQKKIRQERGTTPFDKLREHQPLPGSKVKE
jgi:hypothetical protein